MPGGQQGNACMLLMRRQLLNRLSDSVTLYASGEWLNLAFFMWLQEKERACDIQTTREKSGRYKRALLCVCIMVRQNCCNTSYEAFSPFSTTVFRELMRHGPLDVHLYDFATDVFAANVPITKVVRF